MLIKKIQEERTEAMKNKEVAKLSTLRLLLAKLEKEKVNLKLEDLSKLSDEQVESVIQRNIKEIDKEIAAYQEVGKEVTNQQNEKELLLTYLPKQLSENEIIEAVKTIVETVVNNRGNFGAVMQAVSKELKGKADMSLASKTAKAMFEKSKS